MSSHEGVRIPTNHTADGGVVVGAESAPHRLVVFEDPQCPFCRQFEEVAGDQLRQAVAAGTVAVEYRMRCFLGIESVRADGALALAAEAGLFDELRRAIFAEQPPENSGGFTASDLIALGERVGLTGADYVAGVRQGRFEEWTVEVDQLFQDQDPRGTPAALLDGVELDASVLFDTTALAELLRS